MKRHDAAKEAKRKKWISLFIAGIMILSALGVYISNVSTSISYNGFKFNQLESGKYSSKISGMTYLFDYSPYSVETIVITGDMIDLIKNSAQVEFTSDPRSEYKESIALAQFEIAKTIATPAKYVRTGFISANDFKLPVIKCEDSTSSVPVILFEKSNQTRVYNNGQCMVFSAASNYDMIALKDRFLYSYLGVMK